MEQPIPLQEAYTQPPELPGSEMRFELRGDERRMGLSGADSELTQAKQKGQFD